MATEFQTTQFQPVTVYDLPTVAFSQAIEGEFTKAGFFSTVSEAAGIGNATITPTERETILDEFKDKIGARGGLSGGLVDIATNPWVWLAFLATPAAAGALKTGGKAAAQGIFNVAPEYHAYVKENAPWFTGWRFLTGNQAFRNTEAIDASREIAKARGIELLRFRETISPVEQAVVAGLRRKGINVKSLDPNKAPAKHREYIKRLDVAIHARLQGLDQNVTRTVSVVGDDLGKYKLANKDITVEASNLEEAIEKFGGMKDESGKSIFGGEGVTEIKAPTTALTDKKEIVEAIMDADEVSKVIDAAGANELVNSYRTYYDDTAVRMFMQEDKLAGKTAQEIRQIMTSSDEVADYIDEDKIVNLWRSQEVRAGDEVEDLFSAQPSRSDNPGVRLVQETMDLVRKDISSRDLRTTADLTNKTSKVIKRVFANNIGNGFYHPRMYDQVDELGQSLLGRVQRKSNIDQQKQAIAASQTMPQTTENSLRTYSQDDLDIIETFSSPAVQQQQDLIKNRLRRSASKARSSGQPAAVSRLGAHSSARFYSNNTANSYALYIHGNNVVGRTAEGAAIRGYSEAWDGINQTKKKGQKYVDATEKSRAAGERRIYGDRNPNTRARNRDVLTEVEGPFSGLRGYYNMADVMNQVDGSIANNQLRGILRETLIPQMLGKSTVQSATENLLVRTTALGAEKTANFLRKAKVDETKLGKDVINSLENFANKPAGFVGAGQKGGIAKYLYMTHLGFNPAAVVLNLTQPWLLGATWMGVGPTLKAYGQAFKEMSGYLVDRAATGKLVIDDATKVKLIQKNFTHSEVLGVGPDVIETLDSIAFPTATLTEKKSAGQLLSNLSMSIFEKGEWMNRLVTAHATDNLYKATGQFAKKGPAYTQRVRDVQQMIQETQFGADFLNTPFTFMGYGSLGKVFGAPEFRQFLSFPLRSVTGMLVTPKQINQGRRSVAGFETGFGRTVDFLRGMGISASLFYAGRNMFEADMSKGLFYKSVTDIVGGDSFNANENLTDYIPTPPFLDLGHDFVRGIVVGDNDLVANSVWRLVPGGIGISRTLSSASPALGLPRDNPIGRFAEKFQRKYADYSKITPTGEVPVFKGDGTFVEFRNPMQLVMQGLGLDLNKSKVRSEEAGYYVKQREVILNYRKDILSRLIANDVSGAMRAKDEYEKRMGIPFTLTKTQIKGFLKNRTIPRNERILDRIPPNARHLYAKYVAADRVNKEVDPKAFVEASSSTARSELMGRPSTFDLDPESIQALRGLMEQQDEKSTGLQQTRSFTDGFVPYGFQ